MFSKTELMCVGLIVANIPIYPVKDTLLQIDVSLVNKIGLASGGDALNQAFILSRLGRKVSICGKIGPDLFGRYLSEEMQKNKIDVSTLIEDDRVSTNCAAVLIHENGSRHFLSHRGSSDNFSIDDIPMEKVSNTRIISIGSLLALPFFRGDALAAFLKKAKDLGCMIAADTKQDNYQIGWKGIKDSIKYIDFFLPSYDEASYLSGETEPSKIVGFFMDAGANNVILKLGDQGCCYRSREIKKEEYLPAMKVDVIDTTGAGDNFVAGFLHGILHGWDLRKCCSFANAVGAISTTTIGAATGVKSEDQVMEFFQTNNNIKGV